MAYNLKKDHISNWDEQDIHISERSSVSSAERISPLSRSNNQHVTPPKPKPSLVYHYNQLPENGVPLATQAKQARKEEKRMRRNFRKAPPGQGTLAPVPEPKQPEMSENYYPYQHYFQATNPDRTTRYQQYPNGELIPHEPEDLSRYIHPPAPSTPPKKSHRRHRKSHHHPDKEGYEMVPKDSQYKFPEIYNQQRFSPKQYVADPYQYSAPAIRDQPFQGSDPNISKHRSKHGHSRSKSHHHHRHQQQPNEYVDKEFRVADASFKKSERSPFFQPTENSFQTSPPAIYNQSSYLPPISPYYYYRPVLMGYYGSPTLIEDERMKSPKIYKPNPRSNFYDRYLNTVITKKTN